jgi:hypothetical protein
MMWPAFFFPLLLMDEGGMMAAIIDEGQFLIGGSQ